jgi:hypothetical protein
MIFYESAASAAERHGHPAPKVGSVEWYFHNHEHGLNHCRGGAKNPYEVRHSPEGGHEISKEYARGHGLKRMPQWFRFPKKTKDGWRDLSSGEKVDVSEVPGDLKH